MTAQFTSGTIVPASGGAKPMSARFGASESPSEEVAVKRNQWGQYVIPRIDRNHPCVDSETGKVLESYRPEMIEDGYVRTTTLVKTITDTYALGAWGSRMAIKGLSIRPDLVALTASTSLSKTQELDEIVKQAKDAAAVRASANLGTALHSFSEIVDRGETPYIPAPFDQDIAAYVAELERLGIRVDPQYMERQIVNLAVGAGGTFDRIVWWNGRYVIGDLKTGKTLKYGELEIALQLWVYATAAGIWGGHVELGGDGMFHPMPEIDTTTALVFHLPVGQGRCDVHKVDLRPAERAARLCLEVRDWRKTKGLFTLLTEDAEVSEPDTDYGCANGQNEGLPFAAEDAEVAEIVPPVAQIERVSALGKAVDAAMRVSANLGKALHIDTETGEIVDEPVSPVETIDEHGQEVLVFGDETPEQEARRATSDADVDFDLAPLADRSKGERGCSVCGRRGHKRGSAKCLGADDPALLAKVTGPAEQTAAEVRFGIEDKITAPASSSPAEVKWCVHLASDGREWTMPPVGAPEGSPWVCTLCGKPSRAGMLNGTGQPLSVSVSGYRLKVPDPDAAVATAGLVDELSSADLDVLAEGRVEGARERRTLADCAIDDGDVAKARELRESTLAEMSARTGPDTVSDAEFKAEEVECRIMILAAELVAERAARAGEPVAEAPDDVQPDPFDGDGSAALGPAPKPPTWAQRLAAATTADELTAIGREAMAAGEWTAELKAAGKARYLKLSAKQG
jgi:hypothetical protein